MTHVPRPDPAGRAAARRAGEGRESAPRPLLVPSARHGWSRRRRRAARPPDRRGLVTGEAMPDLRLYRVALLVAVVLAAGVAAGPAAAAGGHPLDPADRLRPAGRPPATSRRSSTTSPAGSPARPADRCAGRWVARQFAAGGLTTHVDTFRATGRRPPRHVCTNVWAASTGTRRRGRSWCSRPATHRRWPRRAPTTTRRAPPRLRRARVGVLGRRSRPPHRLRLDRRRHERGARRARVPRSPSRPVDPRRRGAASGRGPRRRTPSPSTAGAPSPCSHRRGCGRSGGPPGRIGGGLLTPLPPVTVADPAPGHARAAAAARRPFVAAGIAAIELSAPGPPRPAVADTLDSVSADTLARSGPRGRAARHQPRRCAAAARRERSDGLLLAVSPTLGRLRRLDPGRPRLPLALVAVDLVRRAVSAACR